MSEKVIQSTDVVIGTDFSVSEVRTEGLRSSVLTIVKWYMDEDDDNRAELSTRFNMKAHGTDTKLLSNLQKVDGVTYADVDKYGICIRNGSLFSWEEIVEGVNEQMVAFIDRHGIVKRIREYIHE